SDELAGFHFEQAHTLRVQLGRRDDRTRDLAERATTHLAAAAAAAFARTDFRSFDQLARRVLQLMLPDDARRAALLYDRGTSLVTLGRPDEAEAVLTEAIESARSVGDRRSEWRAQVERALVGGS